MNKKNFFIIVIIVLAVGITGSGLLVQVIAKNKLKAKLIDQYVGGEMLLASQIAQHMEIEVSSIYDKLVLISQMPEVISGDSETCVAKLKEIFVNMRDKVGNLGRMDSNGVFDCSVQPLRVRGRATLPHLKQILEDEKHQPVFGRGLISPNNNRYGTSLHVPLFKKDGTFTGTVGAATYFDELKDKHLKNAVFSEHGYMILMDDNGDIFYHPRDDFIGKNFWSDEIQQATYHQQVFNESVKAAATGRASISHYVFEGEERIAALSPAEVFPGRLWILIATAPIKDILKPLK